ncbi:glycoside hydrolase family 108 protein [Bacteroides ilei]|uniref:glycoside hydrolase family 108 protein n=1 Tax=Bacteroides ilei TaxID=1907658 RepID=UPI000931654D|nr:glycosyl hydrolase 108 family protein [Bacteroides ilei]
MADINVLVPLILKWEGGFVNDPDDLGGATNMGVTLATYRQYRKSRKLPAPTVDDLKNLSREEWTDILKTYYWDRWQADRIRDQSVANILVDWVWASGVYGIRIPQQILDVTADGIVGKNTLAALHSYSPQAELFGRIKQARFEYIDRICTSRPANRKFRKGWENRIRAFRFLG